MSTYDPSNPSGPNPMVTDVNTQYNGPSDVYIQVGTGCVWLILPGIALLYAGLSRKRSAISLLFMNFFVWGAVSIIWYLLGYSLVSSVTGNSMIGTLGNGGMKSVKTSVDPSVGELNEPVYSIFQCYFCVATVCIMIGGGNERARVIPSIIFACIWSIIVYDFAAYWTWNANGWLYKLGTMDFAGGSPVHIASGFGALAYALVLGPRHNEDGTGKNMIPKVRPHNVLLVFMGTSLIYFGWLFFNSGTALNDTVRSTYAFCNTNLAASSGLLTYSIVHYLRNGHRWSIIAACEGVIAGLVGITPAAGFVPFYFAIVIGIVTALICNLTDGFARLVGIDEGLEVFNLHGIGGFVGGICTALFGADWVAKLDGATEVDGGWIDGHWVQLGYNLAGCVSIAAWSFVMTVVILLLMNWIPGLRLRITKEEELAGYDSVIMEENLGDISLEGLIGVSTHSPKERSNKEDA